MKKTGISYDCPSKHLSFRVNLRIRNIKCRDRGELSVPNKAETRDTVKFFATSDSGDRAPLADLAVPTCTVIPIGIIAPVSRRYLYNMNN